MLRTDIIEHPVQLQRGSRISADRLSGLHAFEGESLEVRGRASAADEPV